MNVTVRISGLAARYLPADSEGDQARLDLSEGATVESLMAQLGMPEDLAVLVVVNDEVIPKARRAGRLLAAGETVSIVPPLKGG